MCNWVKYDMLSRLFDYVAVNYSKNIFFKFILIILKLKNKKPHPVPGFASHLETNQMFRLRSETKQMPPVFLENFGKSFPGFFFFFLENFEKVEFLADEFQPPVSSLLFPHIYVFLDKNSPKNYWWEHPKSKNMSCNFLWFFFWCW